MKIGSADTPAGFTVTSTITFEQFANLMVSFIESGDPVTRCWCLSVTPGPHSLKAWRKSGPTAEVGNWYADPKFWALPDWQIAVCEDKNEDGDVSASGEWHTIDASAVQKGIAKLAGEADYRHHLHDLLNNDEDAGTADIFMQFICLGSEVYA